MAMDHKTTLGAQLRQSQELEATRTAEAARRKKEQEDAEQAAQHKAVEEFFEAAKAQVTRRIQQGETLVEVLLGNTGRESRFREVEQLLRCADYSCDLQTVLSRPSHPYRQQVAAFKSWAASEELQAKFEYRHDGVGIHSWHVLVVQPNT